MSRPPLVGLRRHREVGRQCVRGRDIGEQAPLHHISDPTEIEAGIVARNPRVGDAERACQFDYGRHGGRHFAVVHQILHDAATGCRT